MDIIGHIVGGGDIGSIACGYDSDDDPETLVNRRIKVSKNRSLPDPTKINAERDSLGAQIK